VAQQLGAAWLKDVPVHPLQHALKDLEKAYKNFFEKRADSRRQLDYKLAWNGGYLISVPPQNTSRTCPCCGHVSADNRRTQERFACVECGFEANADLIGAINVLRAGHARLACADTSPEVGASGQEPTEATIQFSV